MSNQIVLIFRSKSMVTNFINYIQNSFRRKSVIFNLIEYNKTLNKLFSNNRSLIKALDTGTEKEVIN